MPVLTTRLAIVPLLTLIWGIAPGMAIAQSLDKDKRITPTTSGPPLEQAQVVESIDPGLWLEPSYGVQFTTGPGSGYDSSFGSFYGWVPFSQDGIEKLFYTEAQARVESESSRWGGNWAVGYRNFASEFIWGGYLSYDLQDVGSWTAHQVGLGVEALHPKWEARLNGYLPVGDRSTTLGSSSTVVDQSFTNAQFSGTNLLVTPQNTVREDVTSQGSLMGVDLEGGMMLESWPGGQLKGFAGTYVYGGPGTDTFVGVRTRLLAEMNNFNFGAALSSDRLYGTNLTFTIGATFGSGARSAQESEILALLSKPLTRQKNIATHTYTESTFTTTTGTPIAVVNPDTGSNWQFETVDLDAGETIAAALQNVQDTRNEGGDVDIVYVQGQGDEGGFEVPSNIRVLSSGPIQTIPVSGGGITGTVTLPNSGSGNYPDITTDISFEPTTQTNQSSELSGFALVNGAGITVSEVSGSVNINNNQISNAASDSIQLRNTSGTINLTIDSNTITSSGENAIKGYVQTAAVVNATIANNQIDITSSDTSDGVDFEVQSDGQLTASITGNTISNTSNSGIEIEAYAGSNIPSLTITGNTITTTGGDGILLLNESDQDLVMVVSNNIIEGSGTPSMNGLSKTKALLNVPISIDIGAGGFGVAIVTLGDGTLNLTAENNSISNSQDAKFGIAVNPDFLFNSNTVTPSLAASTVSNRVAGSAQVDATIRLNTFSGTGIGLSNLTSAGLSDYNTGSFGMLVGSSGTACINLENNTATEIGSSTISGYQFVQNGGLSTLTLGTNSGNMGSSITTEGTVGLGICN